MNPRLQAAVAFGQTLWRTRPGLPRAAFEAVQGRMLARWLAEDLPRAAFYADASPRLEQLPVTDKALVMSRFDDFNLGRITAAQGWEALVNTGEISGVSIGASTGTSGNRALYAITQAERYRWLGTILAKTIPAFLVRHERVAILLPQSSALYEGANRMPGLALRFYDLREGPEAWAAALKAFAPTTIVAPPRVLRHLAETADLAPRRLYAAAETLDPVDRALIEARFGLTLGQIYMASEGLFATSCRHGRLHLAEDANFFEFEPAPGGLVSPLITSFARSFQIMARYRMNDLLRLSEAPCPCGSPLRAVDEVVGRMDDVFAFGSVLVTPDILRNSVLDASRQITDFRLIREAGGAVVLVLSPEVPQAAADAALAALGALFGGRGLAPELRLERADLGYSAGPKLRRVENRHRAR